MKHTKERLEEAAAASVSVAGVLRFLGLRQGGGTHTYISRRLREFEIDTSHFLGQGANRGKKSPTRLSWQQILVLRSTRTREAATRLRRSLCEMGRPYRCANCGQTPEWQQHPLVLQVDHVNGNFWDNRPTNLRFLCPNCHSQTKFWSGRTSLEYHAIGEGRLCICGRQREKPESPRCRACTTARQEHADWPSDQILALMVWDMPATKIAELLGVSSVAVKRRCTRRGISTPPRGYWAKVRAKTAQPPEKTTQQIPECGQEPDDPKELRTRTCSCGAEKQKRSKMCSVCKYQASERIVWPTNEELARLVRDNPVAHVAKELGVSDVAVRKRCLRRQITLPPRGYWAKRRAARLVPLVGTSNSTA